MYGIEQGRHLSAIGQQNNFFLFCEDMFWVLIWQIEQRWLSRAHCCTEKLLCGPWSSVCRIQNCGDAWASLWLLVPTAGYGFGGSYPSLLEPERAVWLNGQQALILLCCMLFIWFFPHCIFPLKSRLFFGWVGIIPLSNLVDCSKFRFVWSVHHCGIGCCVFLPAALTGCTVIPDW